MFKYCYNNCNALSMNEWFLKVCSAILPELKCHFSRSQPGNKSHCCCTLLLLLLRLLIVEKDVETICKMLKVRIKELLRDFYPFFFPNSLFSPFLFLFFLFAFKKPFSAISNEFTYVQHNE